MGHKTRKDKSQVYILTCVNDILKDAFPCGTPEYSVNGTLAGLTHVRNIDL